MGPPRLAPDITCAVHAGRGCPRTLRSVKAWAGIFVDAVAAGELRLPCDAEQFAYRYVRIGYVRIGYVRIGETLVHGELLAGVSPDRRTTERLRRLMLDGPHGNEAGRRNPLSEADDALTT